MGFNISISEMDDMVEGVYTSVTNWKSQLLSIRDKLDEFINDDELTGEGAESIKANLSNVYVYAIDTLITALTAYNTQLGLYAAGLYSIESDRKGMLNEEHLNDICDKLDELVDETEDAYDRYGECVADISGMVDVEILSKSSYTDKLSGEKTRIEEDIINKVNDLDNGNGGCNNGETAKITDLITAVKTILSEASASKLSLKNPDYSKDILDNIDIAAVNKEKMELEEYSVTNSEAVYTTYTNNDLCGYDGDISILEWIKKILSAMSGVETADYGDTLGFLLTYLYDKTLASDEVYGDFLPEIKKFVPEMANNGSILNVFESLSDSLPQTVIDDQLMWNKSKWENKKNKVTISFYKDGSKKETVSYIEYQNQLTDMKYGIQNDSFSNELLGGDKLTAAANSCEVIAVYNTLKSMNNNNYDFPDLLAKFEKSGIVLNGYFGTSPKSVNYFLQSEGYDTKMVTDFEDISNYDIQNEYTSFIVTVYNDKTTVSGGVHTMSITKEYVEETKNYQFVLHNSSGSTGYTYSDSIEELINNYGNGDGQFISIIGVKDE